MHLPFVAGFARNDKFHLKGLDLAATEINGKTFLYLREKWSRSKSYLPFQDNALFLADLLWSILSVFLIFSH